jgi:hypothetical protein
MTRRRGGEVVVCDDSLETTVRTKETDIASRFRFYPVVRRMEDPPQGGEREERKKLCDA